MQAEEENISDERKISNLAAFLHQPYVDVVITQLIICGMSFFSDMLSSLECLIRIPSTLRKLCLSHNALTEEDALFLCPAFESNKDLTHIDLSHNMIGNAVIYFRDMLATHSAWEYLGIDIPNEKVSFDSIGADLDVKLRCGEEKKIKRAIYWNSTFGYFWQKNPPPYIYPSPDKSKGEDLKQEIEKFYENRHRTPPIIYTFIHSLHKNTSLRHVVLNLKTDLFHISKNFMRYLRHNTTLEKIEIFEKGKITRETKKINRKFKKTRKDIIAQRKSFTSTLILLNYCGPWQSLPRDIKLLIYSVLYRNHAFDFGKSPLQILACANFIFSQAQECHRLIKSNQKVSIIESKETAQKYSFRFFTPSLQKREITLVAEPNMPIAAYVQKPGI